MVDPLTPEARSAFMANIRSGDTKPEIAVRHLLHRLGYRYRIRYKLLSGRPDIVFTAKRKAIFVHGCFWHRHEGCKFSHIPKTRPEYWLGKFKGNKARDARNLTEIRAAGWKAKVVWECEIRNDKKLLRQLVKFLGSPRL